MAYVHNNQFTKGLSGSVGNIIFRQLNGKTVVSVKRDRPREQSKQQRENRFKFKCASAWAKATMLDADKKAYYMRKAKKLKLPNAYTAAISDYMRKGEIREIDTRQYKGKAGNLIRFKIHKKDFAIHKVKVDLCTADGTLVESGHAIKDDNHAFYYKVSQTIPDKVPITIWVTIADHIMNRVTKQEIIKT